MIRRELLHWAATAGVSIVASGVPLHVMAAGTHIAATKPFSGPAVESGTAALTREGGRYRLTLSDDFSIHQEPPDPHWRVVDRQGNVFLLDKLAVDGGKTNKSIVLPPYIRSVAKVQMWCAFAESVLGEAPFAGPVNLR